MTQKALERLEATGIFSEANSRGIISLHCPSSRCYLKYVIPIDIKRQLVTVDNFLAYYKLKFPFALNSVSGFLPALIFI